jgi:ferredoxin-type protein NapG
MRTPKLSFSDNSAGDLNNLKYCDLCAAANEGQPLCVEKCPTQALCYDAGEAVDGTVLGMAVLNTDLCMAYRSSYCAFCYDACRQVRGEADAAIYFANADALGADATKLPLLDTTKCNGCGACESVCVSTQAGSVVSAKERAIIIKPLSEIAG